MKHERFLSHGPVLVCAARHVDGFVKSPRKRQHVKSVLSISDPLGCQNYARPDLTGVRRFVRLTFQDDLDREEFDAPKVSDVETILRWGREFSEFFLGNRNFTLGDKVVIHCYAGHSRSTAAAAMCFAQALGPGREQEALLLTDKSLISSGMQPNSLMMLYADRLLGRHGALLRAIEPWMQASKARYFYEKYLDEVSDGQSDNTGPNQSSPESGT